MLRDGPVYRRAVVDPVRNESLELHVQRLEKLRNDRRILRVFEDNVIL